MSNKLHNNLQECNTDHLPQIITQGCAAGRLGKNTWHLEKQRRKRPHEAGTFRLQVPGKQNRSILKAYHGEPENPHGKQSRKNKKTYS
ncbi:MAG: hypothetical protein LIO64_04115 [Akkermansia sp.]|nr:hypothetical protein [Akkermansia sp.]